MMMTEAEAAKYIGVTPRVLRNARTSNSGPSFIRLNHKIVRYAPADLDAWLEASRVRPQKTAA